MDTADFLDENLSGNHGLSDSDALPSALPAVALPHGDAGRVEECADPEEAYGQDGQEILEKPTFDELKCRGNPAGDHGDDHGRDDADDDADDYADEDADYSYESAPYEGEYEERIA